MWESRVLQRAFERLELHEGKLSRAVLRGGGGGDVTSLPDPQGSNPLGPPGPELRRHRATIARLGVIVAITVEDYYAQGEAVLAAAPRKNVKEHEMLRLYPAGVY